MRSTFRWLLPLSLSLAACDEATSGDAEGGGGDGGAGASSSPAGPGPGPGTGGAPHNPNCQANTTVHEGEGTFYDFADGSGNCSFPATPDDLMVGAMNQTDYANSAPCGACVEVTGPNGTVKVRIVDRCPECPQGDIDLSPEAFEFIAPLEQGRVDISWRYVACDVEGPMQYHFKEGSNPFWTAIQLRNHTYAIAKVEAKGPDGNYAVIERLEYNYFVADSGLGEGPYALRVTDVFGQVIEDPAIPFGEDTVAPSGSQFGICAGD